MEKSNKISERKDRGGLVVGDSHAEGGVPFKLTDSGTHIEEEGDEVNVPREIADSDTVYEFEGTNYEILDKILGLGGLKLTNKVTEVKSGDIVICIKSAWDDTPRKYKGTPRQILSAINESKGCNHIESGAKMTNLETGATVSMGKGGTIPERAKLIVEKIWGSKSPIGLNADERVLLEEMVSYYLDRKKFMSMSLRNKSELNKYQRLIDKRIIYNSSFPKGVYSVSFNDVAEQEVQNAVENEGMATGGAVTLLEDAPVNINFSKGTFSESGLSKEQISFLKEIEKLWLDGDLNQKSKIATLKKWSSKGEEMLDALQYWEALNKPLDKQSAFHPSYLSDYLVGGGDYHLQINVGGEFNSRKVRITPKLENLLSGVGLLYPINPKNYFFKITQSGDLYMEYQSIIGSRMIASNVIVDYKKGGDIKSNSHDDIYWLITGDFNF